jgi:hypothetical protein
VEVVFVPLETTRGSLFHGDSGWMCLVNSRMGAGERLWTLGHELFHRLDSIYPERNAVPWDERDIEQATARLLCPAEELQALCEEAPDLYTLEETRAWVNHKAEAFGLSFSATCFYLQQAGLMNLTTCEQLVYGRLRRPTHSQARQQGWTYPAAVLEGDREPSPGSEYRRPGDPLYWVRCCERPPQGFTLAHRSAKVVGVRVEELRLALEAFILGTKRSLKLEREPDNPADRHAVAVWGCWRDSCGRKLEAKIGYLERELAARLAHVPGPEASLAATTVLIFLAGEGKSAGLRIAVWAE